MIPDDRLPCGVFAASPGGLATPRAGAAARYGAATPSGGAGRRLRTLRPASGPARTTTPHAPRLAALAPTAGGRAPGFDFLDRLRR